MINITLPDNSVRQYPQGITGMEIAKSISEGLARNVLAVLVNDEVWDATRPIRTDARVRLLAWPDKMEEGSLERSTKVDIPGRAGALARVRPPGRAWSGAVEPEYLRH